MFLIVPHRVTSSSVEVFVGAFFDFEPPLECRLVARSGSVEREAALGASRWRTLAGDNGSSIHHLRWTFSELSAATRLELELLDRDGRVLSHGSAETLPECLPLDDRGSGPERPFTIWLSSCFYSPRAAASLASMVQSVVHDDRLRPHVKLLAGDQVYLDFPQTKTIFFSQERLRQHFNEVYTSSWTHPAFSELLRHGGNCFLADDHELWNNYPEPPVPILWHLRGEGFHRAWERLARERCEVLQSVVPLERLEIVSPGQPPELVLIKAQTRLERSEPPYRIMSEAAMDQLVSWIGALSCPAILALSQPIFARTDDGEWSINDYRQFRERLLPALLTAPQDVVVVTGDPHFGRIGVVRFGEGAEARKLIEVIASPLSLVTPLVGESEPPLPGSFPCFGPEGERHAVEYPRLVPAYESGDRKLSEEHAMLLRFSRAGADKLRFSVVLRLARHESASDEWIWETQLNAGR
jgi:hypothetical protein